MEARRVKRCVNTCVVYILARADLCAIYSNEFTHRGHVLNFELTDWLKKILYIDQASGQSNLANAIFVSSLSQPLQKIKQNTGKIFPSRKIRELFGASNFSALTFPICERSNLWGDEKLAVVWQKYWISEMTGLMWMGDTETVVETEVRVLRAVRRDNEAVCLWQNGISQIRQGGYHRVHQETCRSPPQETVPGCLGGGDGDRQQRVTWSDLALAGDDSPPLSLLSMCRALSKQIVGYWKILNGSFYFRVRGTTLELQLSSCACFLCHFQVS